MVNGLEKRVGICSASIEKERRVGEQGEEIKQIRDWKKPWLQIFEKAKFIVCKNS